jgi:glycogen debranching enzyme
MSKPKKKPQPPSDIEELWYRAHKSAERMANILKMRAPKQIIKGEIDLLSERIQWLLDALNRRSN